MVDEERTVKEIADEERLAQARDIVISAMGRAFALYGMPDVIGRIYGLLYFAEQPMGLEEIALELGVSKATASINARILEEFKFVRKVWQKGSRRDYYEAQRNFTKAFLEVLQTNLQKELEITSEAIAQSKDLIAQTSDARDAGIRRQAGFYQEQLSELDKQYRTYGRLASILGMGEKLWKAITFRKD